MSKAQITIAKPDKSRSCHHCRHSQLPPGPTHMLCCIPRGEFVEMEEAQDCDQYRDSRQTSQVISAGGKVGPA